MSGGVFEYSLIENSPGFISVLFEGRDAKDIFKNENGGHRWQRRSPTEKRGRIHTSTVTVAVLDPSESNSFKLDERDVTIDTKRGSGSGGQHKNKTDSCVVATHRPTKISVTIDSRSQHKNKALALKILAARVSELKAKSQKSNIDNTRKQLIGSGMRGDKSRTYRAQDNTVTDHITGKTWRLSDWMKGNW